MKVFAQNAIRANGRLLERKDFRLFSDLGELVPVKEKAERIIAKAEEILEKPIPALPLSLYREFHVNGNRSHFERCFFDRRGMAMYLALAEGLENKGRFTEKLADLVWAIMEESTWVIPAHIYNYPYHRDDGVPPVIGEETLHGIDLFAGTTASCLTIVYLNAKEALDGISKTICLKMEHMINERIIKPFLQCPFWWTGEQGRKVNNWGPWICENLLLTMGVFVEDMKIREAVVNRCIVTLDNFLDGYAPDGGCDEGAGYWGGAGAALFDCLEALEDLSGGKINVYGSELIRNIGDYIYKVNINGKYFVNFADCSPIISPSAALLVRYGRKCGSPALCAFGMKMAANDDFGIDYWQGYRGLKSLYVARTEAKDCEMPTFCALPDLGVMTAREYGDSAKGTFLAMKGGHNNEMHNHNDVGNFVVYRDATPVIIDVGVGEYTKQTFSADRYKLWFMQSGYHNLPAFGGVDQPAGGRYRGKILELNEEKKRMVLDLTAAYPETAGLKSYTRCASLDGSTVTVTDSYERTPDANGDTVFHFMTCREPVKRCDGEIALECGMTLYYDTALTAEIETFEPKGLNAKSAWGTEMLYRIKLTSKEKIGCYTFTVK